MQREVRRRLAELEARRAINEAMRLDRKGHYRESLTMLQHYGDLLAECTRIRTGEPDAFREIREVFRRPPKANPDLDWHAGRASTAEIGYRRSEPALRPAYLTRDMTYR